MAKDYFEDVVPPDDNERDPSSARPFSQPPATPATDNRSIRNVNIPQRPRPMSDFRGSEGTPYAMPRQERSSRRWVWVIAILAVLAIALALVLFVFRRTTVTVTPQSQTVVFDQNSEFTAYPESSAATGTLTYTVQATDIQDSTPVQSSGSEQANVKATGSITVVNDYSAKPVRLIKNTRFETPSGLIFRAPSDIVIPGKSGSTAGSVTVTIVADQPGATYNIAPVSKFTVPGLQSTPDMYANIYAYSTASTTGGFTGTRPSVDQATASAAFDKLRSDLAQKAAAYATSLSSGSSVAFPSLENVTYQDLPNSVDSAGTVHVNESAHVVVPIFPSAQFASAIASTVAANTTGASVRIVPGPGFAASALATTTLSGTTPFTFTLSGQATIVWNIDTHALASALAGKSQSAFQTITGSFGGIKEAHARIEPFWENSFPSNPAQIYVNVVSPVASSSSQTAAQ